MPKTLDYCCSADVEALFHRDAGPFVGLSTEPGSGLSAGTAADVDWGVLRTATADSERLTACVFHFDVLLQDFRHVWSQLDVWHAGSWRVAAPCWPDSAGWDALRELPRASRALDAVVQKLAEVSSAGLGADAAAAHRCMVTVSGLLSARLARARASALPESWARRFRFMALTALRFPELFDHRDTRRTGLDSSTRTALRVLASSGVPDFAVSQVFDDAEPDLADGGSVGRAGFCEAVQGLCADPLWSAPDRVLASSQPTPSVRHALRHGWWGNDLVWWSAPAVHGDWLIAVVPAACAVFAAADNDGYADLGVPVPDMLGDPFLLDVALAVADTAENSGVDPLRFAAGVLASKGTGAVSDVPARA